MTTPINNIFQPKLAPYRPPSMYVRPQPSPVPQAQQRLVEHLDETITNGNETITSTTTSTPDVNVRDICSRVTSLEKIIYFLAGAIIVAIFYRH
jgi:hypothetical protein